MVSSTSICGVKAGRGVEDYAIDVSEKVNAPEVVAWRSIQR